MTQMVEFSDMKFNINLANMLRALMEKVNNIQEHVGWREKDGNSKNLKEILGVRISEMRECFWWAQQLTRH